MLSFYILQSYMTKDRSISKDNPTNMQQDEQLPETYENDGGKTCCHIFLFSELIFASHTFIKKVMPYTR